ncbi:MAG: hypothetical protein DRO67_00290 [Candidatus Asgardarchaeum californiense]|nr:MAG: hypothetical protein DRO67_00290 [Candidatus Asgardarchaeum californiense]
MHSDIQKAADIAEKAHTGQTRKYTGRPYVTHPYSVACYVKMVTKDSDMICAALLHDTVEDTDVTLDYLSTVFNPRVVSLVENLTDISVPEDGNRKRRKTIDLKHTVTAHPDAKTIKLADLVDNSRSITQHDPNFAVVYMKEKERLLDVLTEGHPLLFEMAQRILIDYYLRRLL